MPCPVCHERRLVEVAVRVGEHQVTMHSCSVCGSRWWDRDGERIELEELLELTASQR